MFHGFHEIFEYIIETYPFPVNQQFLADQIEISMFAISSMFLVLGSLHRGNFIFTPGTYYVGGSLVLTSLYFVWLPDLPTFEGIHKPIEFLFLKTNGHRLLFGLFMGVIPVIVFAYLTIHLYKLNNKYKNTKLRSRMIRTSIAMIASFLFMLAEGFTYSDPNIVIIKAIAALLILSIPINIISTKKMGLKSLLIFNKGGLSLYSYIFDQHGAHDTNALTIISGFLSAVQVFSQEEMKQGGIKTLQSQLGTVIFSHNSGIIAGLISEIQNPDLETTLTEFLSEFVNHFDQQLKTLDNNGLVDLEEFAEAKEIVLEKFIAFMN